MAITAPTLVDDEQLTSGKATWWIGYGVIVGAGFTAALLARRRVGEPFLGLSLVLLFLLVVGWALRPRATLYTTVFLTSVSEPVTIWWFPFAKNLSSRESIAYVADALTVSPLQIALYTGTAVSLLRHYSTSRRLLPRVPLMWPLVVFSAFLVFGLVNGVVLGGGDLRIAIFESRFMFNIALVFVICALEFEREAHFRYVLYAILAGVALQALISIEHFAGLPPEALEAVDSISDHGATLGHNMVLVTLLVAVLFGIKRPLLKWAMLVTLVPVAYVMVVAQRRAGIAALIVAAPIIAIALYWRRRRAFWLFCPAVAVLAIGYTLAFWNSTGGAGFAAQAIKGVISPDLVSAEQQSSDLYRLAETFNLNYTIRSNPIRGLGFGQAFYQPITLPVLSFFELQAYLPHNTILWLWIKVGFGGFVTFVYIIGKALMLGAAKIRSLTGVDLAVAVVTTTYIAMFVVYSWVDISWDARNSTILGWALAAVVFPTPAVTEPRGEPRSAMTPGS